MNKHRAEIPTEIATELLFASDRTCCVCRKSGKPVQLHHIDDDPANSVAENLAVLCFDCHWETQIRGGFDRKLDAAQVKRYKSDWVRRVESMRTWIVANQQQTTPPVRASDAVSLRYFQVRESSDEHRYDIEAEYSLMGADDDSTASEVNALITAFVTRELQCFRYSAMQTAAFKMKMHQDRDLIARDGLWITHEVSLISAKALSLVFQVGMYGAGAAHPNTRTEALNFVLRPPLQVATFDIISRSNGLQKLSAFCEADLLKQKMVRWADMPEMVEQIRQHGDDWVRRGSAPTDENYRHVSVTKTGLVVYFDPYQVGSYAEGRYEVFVPAYELKGFVDADFSASFGWIV